MDAVFAFISFLPVPVVVADIATAIAKQMITRAPSFRTYLAQLLLPRERPKTLTALPTAEPLRLCSNCNFFSPNWLEVSTRSPHAC